MRRADERLAQIVRQGVMPLVIGADDSIPPIIARALANQGTFDVVTIDAQLRCPAPPIDAIRGELKNTVDHALAVGGRFGAERAQELVIGLAGGADDARAADTGELHGRRPRAAGGPLTRTVWSAPTPRRSSARTAVSAAAGSPAASAHESPVGLPA